MRDKYTSNLGNGSVSLAVKQVSHSVRIAENRRSDIRQLSHSARIADKSNTQEN